MAVSTIFANSYALGFCFCPCRFYANFPMTQLMVFSLRKYVRCVSSPSLDRVSGATIVTGIIAVKGDEKLVYIDYTRPPPHRQRREMNECREIVNFNARVFCLVSD